MNEDLAFAFDDANSIELPDGCRVMRSDLRPCGCCGGHVREVVAISRLTKAEGRPEFWGEPRISVQCPDCLGLERLDFYQRSRQRREHLGTIDHRDGVLRLIEDHQPIPGKAEYR